MNPLRSKRSLEVERRIKQQAPAPAACAVLGCPSMTQAHLRAGLNRNYCAKHVAHYLRHGSYSKPSYRAADLATPRLFALRWLQANAGLRPVVAAREQVEARYARAGAAEEAFRLTGKPPAVRAKYVWARLAEKEVDTAVVLAAWIGVELAHRADPRPERQVEFRWVQAAKVLHRLAGGSHRRWESEGTDGRPLVAVFHKYPGSRGRVLRHVGRALAEAARPLADLMTELEQDFALASAAMRGSVSRLPRARRSLKPR